MLLCNDHRTEAIIVIAITIITIEGTDTSIATIPEIASTFEEWITVAREVRVVSLIPSIGYYRDPSKKCQYLLSIIPTSIRYFQKSNLKINF